MVFALTDMTFPANDLVVTVNAGSGMVVRESGDRLVLQGDGYSVGGKAEAVTALVEWGLETGGLGIKRPATMEEVRAHDETSASPV